jgi:hypothetical protein
MSKTIGLLSLGAVLAAGPALAFPHVQGIPGASCAVDGRTSTTWEYRNRRLLNTSSDPGAWVLAVCPVSVFAPSAEPQEFRVYVTDPVARTSWCKGYSSDGSLYSTQLNPGGGTRTLGWGVGPWGGDGWVEVTFHCLLYNGASIDRIEIVWDRP